MSSTYAPSDSSRRISLLILVMTGLMAFSCQKKNNKHDGAADTFDTALETATKRYGGFYEPKAAAYIDSVYRNSGKLSVMERFKFYDFNCGYNFHATKDYLKAMAYADSMAWVIEQSNNQDKMVKQYAQAYYCKGDVYFITGNYQEAYQAYFKTKIIARELDKCTSSEYNYRLGMVLYKQRRFRSAAGYFKAGFTEAAVCKTDFANFWRRQELLSNTALSYSKANMPDSALSYYNQALQFLDQNEPIQKVDPAVFRTARGVVYGNMGDLYVQKKELAKAEELFKKSIGNNSAPRTELADGQLTRIKLARLYRQQQRDDDFRQVLRSVEGGMDTINNAEVTMNWNELMSGYYRAVGQPTKGLDHLLAYNRLRDSIQESNKALLREDANTQLLRLETEYEFDLLRKNSRLQQWYLVIAIVFALLVLVIFFLVYNNARRAKQSIKKLEELNDQVSQQNAALETTLASLEHNSREKDRILHAVAHDLRNPIGGIASVSGIMLDSDGNNADQQEMLNLIQRTSNDTLTLINELLEAAEGSHIVLAGQQWTSVSSLLRDAADLLQFKASEKKQRIETLLTDEDLQVFINREKMNRVIGNLISNAIKFSPEGATITLKAYLSGDKTILAVIDQGIGIPDKLKESLFDMFTAAKRPGTSGEKPFGLGLYISNEIVKAHNGRLWFENNSEGAGATFFVELEQK
ncbi:tetratricopeptide repeat-containing sensor histidine kinase [Daejeonella lutea]|uniref:histidine kinase n=1 Tax=Daejeonella lutea TaxID=572036 RepID=A0A1T5CY49_9SPHI|nr:ATP-binding protein [Daejeonella lutea]SKB64273.1 Signal transduction histidine kinase [Daejeonella lutea]